MNRRFQILLAFCVLLLITAAVLLLGKRAFKRTVSERASQQQSSRAEGSSAEARTDTTVSKPEGAGVDEVAESETTRERTKLETLRRVMERDQVPLNFYGRVVDEANNPLANVDVAITYTRFAPLEPLNHFRGEARLSLATETNGRFTVQGIKGYGLTIQLSKDGYRPAAKNFKGVLYVHGPEQFKPDPANVVEFRMLRKGTPEPLVRYSEYYFLPRDGTPLLVDLLSGRTNGAFANLKIQAWTDAANKDEHYRYDWRVRLEMIQGGLAESTDDAERTAPASGYEATYEINYPKNIGSEWRPSVEKTLMFQTDGGRIYGQMKFRMNSGGQHFCTITAVLNPSGSRNLEPDPKLLFPDLESYNRYMAKQKQTSAKP